MERDRVRSLAKLSSMQKSPGRRRTAQGGENETNLPSEEMELSSDHGRLAGPDAECLWRGANAHPATRPDTDADNLPDDWEQAHFGSLIPGAGDDPDRDGVTHGEELFAGTDPRLSNIEDTANAIGLFVYTP